MLHAALALMDQYKKLRCIILITLFMTSLAVLYDFILAFFRLSVV
jgi:hypothetical protein